MSWLIRGRRDRGPGGAGTALLVDGLDITTQFLSTSAPVVHIYFVLDRSPSMEVVRQGVIEGYNALLTEQRHRPGGVLMTFIQFSGYSAGDRRFTVLADAVPLSQMPPLDDASFVTASGTALYDAMGEAIAGATRRRDWLRVLKLADERVLFITMTDGGDNESQEYDAATIAKLVAQLTAEGWTFAYLGANQDATAEGAKAGYGQGSTGTWQADPRGAAAAFRTVSDATKAYREAAYAGQDLDPTAFFVRPEEGCTGGPAEGRGGAG